MHVYRVQPGDTLQKIANHYRVTSEQLMQCNGLPASPFLLPGQALAIPSLLQVAGTEGFSTYQVQEGETLRDLSRRYRIPLTWLAFCNLLHENRLRSGDVVLVPHTNKQTRQAPPVIHWLTFDESTQSSTPTWPRTHRGVRGLRVDATGRLHLPEGNLSQDKSLLLCTLDGPQGVIPQVARAILRSDATQQAILDGLAARLSAIGTGSHGIIFDWQEVLPDCQTSYLAFVKEAGRRLRPMGLQIGLHLPAHSPWQKKIAQVSVIASSLDHLYYEPARRLTNEKCLYPTPPSPLIGVGETRDALTHATDWFPSQKIWLVNRSAGLITKQGEVLETISPHAALQLAYHQEAPLCRDSCSELAWFRTREGGYTVWFEDLWSMVRKIELLHHMNLQGLAMWESGGYFPDAWNYVRDYFETTAEKDTHN